MLTAEEKIKILVALEEGDEVIVLRHIIKDLHTASVLGKKVGDYRRIYEDRIVSEFMAVLIDDHEYEYEYRHITCEAIRVAEVLMETDQEARARKHHETLQEKAEEMRAKGREMDINIVDVEKAIANNLEKYGNGIR